MIIKSVTVGPLQTNCYILSDDKKNTVIIDPGSEEWKISEILNNGELDVKYIFLTHGHYDHFLAADKIRKERGAKILIHKEDANGLSKPDINCLCWFPSIADKSISADITVEDGEKLKVGDMEFEFIHTPGHTVGSMCILCEDAMFSGDTLFRGDVGRCDLPGGNYNSILKSVNEKLFRLEKDYTVYPGHLESTTLFYEKENNSAVR